MTAVAEKPGETRTRGREVAQRFFVVRELGVGLALVLLIVVTALVNPRFLAAQSIKDLLLGATILAILATGQAIVVITRNVDLSVGSVLGLSAFATGSLFLAAPAAPIPLAILLGVALGAAAGAVNGLLIAAARVPALVVTLGTLYVYRGLLYTWATGKQINAADMPSGFLSLGTRTVLGVPVLALFAVAVVVGGVAIFGGSGSVYGAALGAVLLTTIAAALPVLGVSPFWQRAAVGALILAAIGLDRVLMARISARLRVRRARRA